MKKFLLSAILGTLSGQIWAHSLLERINNGGEISIGTEGTYAPFTFHDKNGKLTGYDVEVSRKVAEKLGFKIKFEETNWDSMLAGLKAGRFDLVANQVALSSPERQASFDRSEPYNYYGAALVIRNNNKNIKDIKDLKNKKSSQTLTSNYAELAKSNGAEIVPADGLAQSLLLIEQNRVDASLNSQLAILDYFLKNKNHQLKIIWVTPPEEKLGAGFIANKGNQEALEKISQAIIELRNDGTLKKIGEQFFGQDISQR